MYLLFLLLTAPALPAAHPNELACGQLSESIAGGKIIIAGLPKKSGSLGRTIHPQALEAERF